MIAGMPPITWPCMLSARESFCREDHCLPAFVESLHPRMAHSGDSYFAWGQVLDATTAWVEYMPGASPEGEGASARQEG